MCAPPLRLRAMVIAQSRVGGRTPCASRSATMLSGTPTGTARLLASRNAGFSIALDRLVLRDRRASVSSRELDGSCAHDQSA